MKKAEILGCISSMLLSSITIFFLITQYSDPKHVMGGWLIPRNSLLLLIPFVIFLFSTWVLASLTPKSHQNNRASKIYLWVIQKTNLLFLILFLFIEIGSIFYIKGIYFSKGIILKALPDVILLICNLVLNLLVTRFVHHKYEFSKVKLKEIIPYIILFFLFILLFTNYKLVGIDFVLAAKSPMGAGAPIFEIQLLLAIFSGLVLFFLLRVTNPSSKLIKGLEIALFVILFLFAYKTWSAESIPLNYLTRSVNDGNLTPYADSRIYDLNGLGFALGEGIGFSTPPAKPLYSFFLGLLHLIYKMDYASIINAQMILLCFIPSVLFLIGKKLFNQPVGLIAAILVVYRENNLIKLSSITTQSSLKMLLSESFSVLFILCFIFAALVWFSHPKSRTTALIAGATLALCILIRAQLLPFILVFILLLIVFKTEIRFNLRNSILFFLVGIGLVLIPWMSRNALRNGQFSLEESGYVNYTITSQTTEMNQLYSNKGPISTLVNDIISNPKVTFEKYSAFFNDSILSSLYQLPTQFGKLDSIDLAIDGSKDLYPYPYKEIHQQNKFFWVMNSVFIFFGVLTGWRKYRWRGLIPLIFYLVYAVSISILKFSGWRFIQPVDWVFLLYWCAGLIGFFELLSPLNSENPHLLSQLGIEMDNPKLHRSTGVAIILITLLGLMMPISELLVPQKNTIQTKSQILSGIINSTIPGPLNDTLIDVIRNNPIIVLKGTLVYPIYINESINSGDLLPGFGHYPAYFQTHTTLDNEILKKQISEQKKILNFTLLNTVAREIYVFSPSPEIDLKSGESAIVIGCDNGNFFEAFLIIVDSQVIKNISEQNLVCNNN